MLTIGKWRGLQAASTQRGTFVILALDHRNNLRALLRPNAPDTVTAAELVEFKYQVVAALAPATSAVLLDPVFGVAQCIVHHALPGHTGLIATLDETGYKGPSHARRSEILEGWSVEKIKRVGGDGVKLLIYYHPEASTARDQEALVKRVADECARYDIAFYLEVLTFSTNPDNKKLRPDEREQVILESARKLSDLGITILKAEFPVDYTVVPDEAKWLASCRRLTQASVAPWVLLSAAAPYYVFKRQVKAAAMAGASGVMVGRAAWQEAGALTGHARKEFLHGEALRRMQELGAILESYARPWTETFHNQVPAANDHWYKMY
jgi:tagatose-1,6-bisphosphate aldolase